MVQLPTQADTTSRPHDQSARAERRRPGRMQDVNTTLLPLLRRESLLDSPAPQRPRDDLAPARGIALGAVVGALMWVGLGLVVFWLI